MEIGEGHPSRAVLILERAESEGCCLHERIWLAHSDLLAAEMGAKDLVRVTRRFAGCRERGWGEVGLVGVMPGGGNAARIGGRRWCGPATRSSSPRRFGGFRARLERRRGGGGEALW